MYYADTIGLSTILRRMRHFESNPHADPEFWRPAPLLIRLAAEGRRFYEGEGCNG
jgi:3-hydroxyacyl-CoA dehydrogenase